MNADNHIKLRHLNCFLEVARQGSIQRAADVLAISQPAVSKTIKELEELLQSTLFARGNRGVQLTDAGTAFVHAAGPGLEALRRGVQSLRSGEYKVGELRLGILSSVEGRFMPRVMRGLHAQHRGLKILVEGGPASVLLGLLRSGDLDLVIGRLSDSPHLTGLHFEHLFGDSMLTVVRAGHPLLKVEPGRLAAQLEYYPLVLPPSGTTLRQHADSILLQSAARVPATRLETLSNTLGRSYVQEADAVWITPKDAVAAEIESGSLVVLALAGQIAGGAVGVASNPALALSLPAQWCIAALRQHALPPQV